MFEVVRVRLKEKLDVLRKRLEVWGSGFSFLYLTPSTRKWEGFQGAFSSLVFTLNNRSLKKNAFLPGFYTYILVVRYR